MTEECKEYETAVQECECCGNAIFPGDDYETCHICKSNLVCEHCQYEAMDGGFSRDTCCFCAQSNPGPGGYVKADGEYSFSGGEK